MPKLSATRTKKASKRKKKTYIKVGGRKKPKINYGRAARLIRVHDSLPFRNTKNFSAAQKRQIRAKFERARLTAGVKKGGKTAGKLNGTLAETDNSGRLIYKKTLRGRRTIHDGYVLDSYRGRREYSIFLTPDDLEAMARGAALDAFRQILQYRGYGGFLGKLGRDEIPRSDWRAVLIYGAYPSGRTAPLDDESFDRYAADTLGNEKLRAKLSGVKIIYHPGDDWEDE